MFDLKTRKTFVKACLLLLSCLLLLMLPSCADSQAKRTSKIEEAVIQVLNSTKVDPMWAPTIGEMAVEVFYDYKVTIEPTQNKDEYIATISGSYNPNPDVPNLAFDGSISYLVNIETGTCKLYSDLNNISSIFLVHILN